MQSFENFYRKNLTNYHLYSYKKMIWYYLYFALLIVFSITGMFLLPKLSSSYYYLYLIISLTVFLFWINLLNSIGIVKILKNNEEIKKFVTMKIKLSCDKKITMIVVFINNWKIDRLIKMYILLIEFKKDKILLTSMLKIEIEKNVEKIEVYKKQLEGSKIVLILKRVDNYFVCYFVSIIILLTRNLFKIALQSNAVEKKYMQSINIFQMLMALSVTIYIIFIFSRWQLFEVLNNKIQNIKNVNTLFNKIIEELERN
ncbi:MAG: hypothetical protein NTX05_07550 [Fusobacteria bacterium]|nr:hypothetical protein [Fusobacteriota bacterium]